MSAASDQKLFCELCSPFNCSFDEFVGEKVVSPSYSSAILAPPLKFIFKYFIFWCYYEWYYFLIFLDSLFLLFRVFL